jgi:SAM-dependent methyltransferase
MELDEYRRMAAVEDSHWWYGATRELLRDVLGPHLVPGGRFLDLGAGTGATGSWMSEHGTLVAADFEPVALGLHRELHPASEPVACDAQALPFADGSFDAVLCVTVLCHRSIRAPIVPVREMARVVRPGGVLLLWEPGVRRLRRAHDRVTHTARRFSRRELSDLLVDAGLEVRRATGAYAFLVPAAAVRRSSSGARRPATSAGRRQVSAARCRRRPAWSAARCGPSTSRSASRWSRSGVARRRAEPTDGLTVGGATATRPGSRGTAGAGRAGAVRRTSRGSR